MRAAKQNAQEALQRPTRRATMTFDTSADMHFATRPRGSLGTRETRRWEKRWVGGEGSKGEGVLRSYKWVRVPGQSEGHDFLKEQMESKRHTRSSAAATDLGDSEDSDQEETPAIRQRKSIGAAVSRSQGTRSLDHLLKHLDEDGSKKRRRFPTETPDSRSGKRSRKETGGGGRGGEEDA
jgi:hypothetical protein